ncbi:MAG: hypothetical protein AAFN63_19710, partial [Pseudomonadota bacterium]
AFHWFLPKMSQDLVVRTVNPPLIREESISPAQMQPVAKRRFTFDGHGLSFSDDQGIVSCQ